ncbi:iron uptake system protein EfeO [Chelatococcus asaccharovorans]|uniref:iron uptake system protein EfeO n=1 Tax=Chelatococcus asaccharovorans TaxID=28210 RepID=UPI00224C709C|nr:iron uptake system protein EfeO [Chelatococcus asaccharovorans]CAH1651545.1 Iron uptake system component EfeO [Chelatococcus asaccharovorans]CAH1686591.1 Iron uptake system component EfeO [Chelatococcus asaccharovorans]
MSDERGAGPVPSRLMRLAVVGAACLAVASGGLFYYATVSRQSGNAAAVIKVEVGAKACTPNALTLPAGRHVFEIHNTSDRPVEWEILDGIMVLEERENIVPGLRQTLAANLKPGQYQITCGLLSNPRGRLTVTANAASDAAAAAGPDLRAFIGPLSEYKVFLAMQGANLVAATEKLADALKAGDLEGARALYEPSRLPYRQVEAVAMRWADLQTAIDPVADYLEHREKDDHFTGYHRLEYGLFAANETASLVSVADKLVADANELKARMRSMKLAPDDLSGGAARLARRLADGKIESGENAYAHSDLADLNASLTGIAKMAGLVRPLIPDGSSDLAQELDARLKAARLSLDALKSGDGYVAYDKVDVAGRRTIAETFRALADTLDKVSNRLSLG